MGRVRLLALSPAIPASLLVFFMSASTVSGACFGSNGGAWVVLADESHTKGLQAIVDLEPATPANWQSTIIAHPAQLLIPASEDFLGFGTKIGAGTFGGVYNCAANSGPRWKVYFDFVSFNNYFCIDDYGSAAADATGQTIELIHGATANGCNPASWTFKYNGNFKDCAIVDGVYGYNLVGGESVGTNPQDIDVRYRSIKYRVIGSSWTNWYGNYPPNGTSQEKCESTGYDVIRNSANDYRLQD